MYSGLYQFEKAKINVSSIRANHFKIKMTIVNGFFATTDAGAETEPLLGFTPSGTSFWLEQVVGGRLGNAELVVVGMFTAERLASTVLPVSGRGHAPPSIFEMVLFGTLDRGNAAGFCASISCNLESSTASMIFELLTSVWLAFSFSLKISAFSSSSFSDEDEDRNVSASSWSFVT